MLGELDTVQILVLQSYTPENQRNSQFREQHQTVFEDERHPEFKQIRYSNELINLSWKLQEFKQKTAEYLGLEKHRQELAREEEKSYNKRLPELTEQYELAREHHSLFKSRLHNLVERGLLGLKAPENYYENKEPTVALTPLGAALLKIIDGMTHSEWGPAEQIHAVEAIWKSKTEAEKMIQEGNSRPFPF